jgi:hypothetical protein
MVSNRINKYLHDYLHVPTYITFFQSAVQLRLRQRLGSYDSGLVGFTAACRYCRMYVHVSCTVYVSLYRAPPAPPECNHSMPISQKNAKPPAEGTGHESASRLWRLLYAKQDTSCYTST